MRAWPRPPQRFWSSWYFHRNRMAVRCAGSVAAAHATALSRSPGASGSGISGAGRPGQPASNVQAPM